MDKKNTFKLTIKTPTDKPFEEDVNSLLVETESGKIMILPHHTSLVGTILFSNVSISQEGKLSEYSVRNGFIYVRNGSNTVELFCLDCEKTQTVKFTSVESYLKFLESELKNDKINSYQLEFLESEKFAVVKQLETLKKEG